MRAYLIGNDVKVTSFACVISVYNTRHLITDVNEPTP